MNGKSGSYSLGQLLLDVGSLVKQYENTTINNETNTGKLLKTKEVLELYPMMTQYGLEQAVKENKIPVVKRGKLNFYDSNDIEQYILNQKQFSNLKNDKCNSKIKYI